MVLLAGCSGGGSEDASTAADMEVTDGLAMDRPAPAAESGVDDAGGDGSEDSAMASTLRSEQLAPQQAAVISTGTVTLRSDDVAAARLALSKVIDTYRGRVAEEQTDTDDTGELVSARVVLRVPSDSFSRVMDDLEAITDFHSRTVGTEDVTTQVIDVEARVRAQSKSLARIEALLAEATTFRDVVTLETQLTTRQAELESLKAQQAWLADQTSMATISVYLEQLPDKKKGSDDSGFVAGLKAGWEALGKATADVVTLIGATLPFVVVLGVLAWPGLFLWRRLRVSRAGAPAQTPSAASTGPDPSSE